MERYGHIDVNYEIKKKSILTFITLKMTLKFKIQHGIHPHHFPYPMNYRSSMVACY